MELIESQTVGTVKTNDEQPSIINCRIKATDNIVSDVYVAKIGNTNKFSKGNISVWSGAAKSKKTFAITMLVSSMLGGVNLYSQFNAYAKNKVLWIDTEQSPFDVQKITKRIVKLIGSETNLYMFGLRPYTPAQRIIMIDEALKIYKCDVLIIDGARDLLMNINDPVESTIIATKLMKWTYDYNIHLSVVLHKSANGLRGHIGTELENKSETVIEVKRNEDDINVSEIREVYGRGKGFQSFNFFIDENGLPVVGDFDLSVEVSNVKDIPF